MLKRLFDIAVSLTALIMLMPIFAAVAIAIKLNSPGPILFRQTRVGRHEQFFRIHKFRTMHAAPTGRSGREITVGNDPRITSLGRYLRDWKIDELPQLLDVLRGKMSIVGPRPEVPRYVDFYSPEVRKKVFSVRPGITDKASIVFIRESEILSRQSDPERFYIETILPEKVSINASYATSHSLVEDMKIIFLTLLSIFARR